MISADLTPAVSNLLSDFLSYAERKASRTEKEVDRQAAPKPAAPKPDRTKVFGVRQSSKKIVKRQGRKPLPKVAIPCQREGCGNVFFASGTRAKRKYCSLECAKIVNTGRMVKRNKEVKDVPKEISFICIGCQKTHTAMYVSGGRPRRCQACLDAHYKAVTKSWNDSRADARKAERVARKAAKKAAKGAE